MEKQSGLEKVSGSLPVAIGTTLIAAANGTWLAGLLPVLAPVIASGRFQKRVEDALKDVNAQLEKHSDKISDISDQQFKLLNESLLAILTCTEDEKIAMLKAAAVNSIGIKDLNAHEATVLARALREVSAVEMHFLRKIISRTEIFVVSRDEKSAWADPQDTKALPIESGTHDNAILMGLANLGLVMSTGSGFGGTLNYKPSQVARQLVALVGH